MAMDVVTGVKPEGEDYNVRGAQVAVPHGECWVLKLKL